MNNIRSRTLLARADHFRHLSAEALEPLAVAYKRRAAELEFLAAVYTGDDDGRRAIAA